MTFSGNIVYLRLRARAANDTTRAQIKQYSRNKVMSLSLLSINMQGQMISRMRVLIIQAK